MNRKKLLGCILCLVMVIALSVTTHAASVHGDFTQDGKIGSKDALYLLRHVLNPDGYEISQSGDVNGDGKVNSRDALYLLRNALAPEKYPVVESHTPVSSGGKAPTCTECGLTAQIHCAVCEKVLTASEEIPATGHTPGAVTGAVTYCGNLPIGETYCTQCGELLGQIDHVLTTEVTPSTCTKDGVRRTYCLRCDHEVRQTIPATGHTDGEWQTIRTVSCREEGLQEKHCASCEQLLESRTIAIREHHYTAETSEGSCEYTCQDCGHTETVDTEGKHQISFVTNGGDELAQIYAEPGSVPELPQADQEGLDFEGWYLDPTLTVPYEDGQITDDLTLYAKWTVSSFHAEEKEETLMRDVGTDFIFTVISPSVITDDNIASFVEVTNASAEQMQLHVVGQENGKYRISGNYVPGDIYKALCKSGATIEESGMDYLWFVTKGPERAEAATKADVITLSLQDVISLQEQENSYTLILPKRLAEAGDIVLITDNNGAELVAALKLLSQSQGGEYFCYSCAIADPADVFENYELFTHQNVDMSQFVPSENLQQDLEQALLDSQTYSVMAAVAERYAMSRSADSSEYKYEFDKIEIKNPKFEVKKGKDKEAPSLNFEFKLCCNFKVRERSSGVLKESFSIVMTISSKVSVSVDAKVSFRGLIKGNYRVMAETGVENRIDLSVCNTRSVDKEQELEFFKKMLDGYIKEGQMPELIENSKTQEKTIKICSVPILNFHGLTMSLDISNVFDFSISGQLGISTSYHSTTQVTFDVHKYKPTVNISKSNSLDVQIYVAGKLTLSESIRLTMKIDLLKLAEASADLTVGPYFEMGGLLCWQWDNENGSCLNAGGYMSAGIRLKAIANWRILFIKSKEPIQLFEKKWELFSLGQKTLPLRFEALNEECVINASLYESLELSNHINTKVISQDLISFKKSSGAGKDIVYALEEASKTARLSSNGTLEVFPTWDNQMTLLVRVTSGNLHKIVTVNVVLDHEHTVVKTIVSGNCLTGVRYRLYCTECRCVHYEDIPPTDSHTFSEWEAVEPETCLADGLYHRACAICNEEEEKTVAAPGHDCDENHVCRRCGQCIHSFTAQRPEQAYLVSAASCCDLAEYVYACEYCGTAGTQRYYYGTYLPHTYADRFTCHDRTCQYPGCGHLETATTEHRLQTQPIEQGGCASISYTISLCLDCGACFSDLGDNVIHGHDHVIMDGIAPTCTEDGSTKWVKCGRCEMVLSEATVLPKLGHELHYQCVYELRHDVSCTRDGCSYQETQRHSFTPWQTVKEKTCLEDGLRSRSCTLCGYAEEETLHAQGHNLLHHAAQSPTCENVGWNDYDTCKNCDYSTYQELDALGHDFATELTATNTQHYYACRRAGCSKTKDLQNHDYSAWSGTEPDCEHAGQRQRQCSTCGHIQTEEQKALGHAYSWIDCGDGVHHYQKCSRCDDTRPETEHRYGAWQTDIKGSCTVDKLSHRVCQDCGYTQNKIEAAPGHLFENWQSDGENHWKVCSHTGCDATDSLGSHTMTEIRRKAPTCTQDGSILRQCPTCDYQETEILPRTGHNRSEQWYHDDTNHYHLCRNEGCAAHLDKQPHTMVQTQVLKEPTCIEEGLCVKVCQTCGYETQESLPALGHDLPDSWLYDEQHHYKICRRETCGVTVEDSVHELQESITEAPTCEKAGIKEFSCSICDYTYTQQLPALGHKWNSQWTADDETHYHGCDNPDCEARQDEAAHSWVESGTYTAPTCEKTGVKEFSCSICGRTRTDTLDALGHDLTHVAAQSPTCTDPGWTAYEYCTRCDHSTYEEIPALGHTGEEWYHESGESGHMHYHICQRAECGAVWGKESCAFNTRTVEPTCTDKGYDEYTCRVCGYSYTDGEVPALGHDYVEHESRQPTCEEPGWNDYLTCTRCDYDDRSEIPALGHEWSSGYHDLGNTGHALICLREGCGKRGTLKSHNRDGRKILQEATCQNDGILQRYCTECGHVYEQTASIDAPGHTTEGEPTCTTGVYCTVCGELALPALGHLYEAEVTFPTCEEQGYTIHTCSRPGCGDSYVDSFTAALGHQWSPQWTADDETHYHGCDNPGCVARQDEAAHTIVAGEILEEPVCEVPGRQEQYCCICNAPQEDLILPALEHVYQVAIRTTIEQLATETVYRHILGQECSRCHNFLQNGESVVHRHDQVTLLEGKAATCDEPGLTDGLVCAVAGCGDVLRPQQDIPALGHDYQNGFCTRCSTPDPTIAIIDSGTCGENLTWILTEDGTLIISGTGEMENYRRRNAPWYTYRADIIQVIIRDGVTSIGSYALFDCSNLTSITIPNSVTSVGDYAFYVCSKLLSIIISDGVSSIGSYAFAYCSSLASIIIPDSVTCISRHAFADCSSLTSFTIPDSVTSIGTGAFSGCTSLTSITIPDSVTSIEGVTFSRCSSLTSIVIPDCVTSIGDSAFNSCSSLTSIVIPDGVTSIGSYAFAYCSSLTSITIPSGVKRIGDFTFDGCSNLTSITIPDGVTSLGTNAFQSCHNLTSITIPDSVTSIADGVFNNCSTLTSINIPNSVTYIGSYAFMNCSSLTTVTIPGGVSGIYIATFQGCHNLTSIIIPDSVTSIGREAFADCSSLTSITIPDSVTSIGTGAFSGCIMLKGIWADSNNPNYSSDNYGVLFNLDKTILIAAPGAIASYEIPSSVTSIGSYAFFGCTSLTSITIPDSVTSIDSNAFWGCSRLTSITIPNSVTSIGSYAFGDCSRLTSITIPDSVTTIEESAFSGCYSLTSITIPDSVTSIEGFTFYDCSSLTSIIFLGDAPTIDIYAFEGITATVYYPAGNDSWTENVMLDYGGNITWSEGLPAGVETVYADPSKMKGAEV